MNTGRPTERPKILLIAPWAPYPFDGGSKRVWSLCRLLKDRFSFTLLTFAPRPKSPRAVADELLREHAFLKPVFDKVLWVERQAGGEAPAAGVLGLPDDAARFYSPAMDEAMRAALKSERPNLVHVEYDLMAAYARLAEGFPRVLTQHDAGTISFFHSYFREMSGFKKFLRVGTWLKRVAFERRAMSWFDRVVVCTEPDAVRMSRIMPAERLRVVPTGVDLSEFAAAPRRESPETLVFVGHFPHYPNEDAALHFAREIWPRVEAARPGARLVLVGSDPTPAVSALAARPNVIVTGTVPSVAPYLAQATLFVAPLRLGQGIKGKILEAFAAGVAVVASPCAADGLGVRHGRELLIASGPRRFAAAVVSLLENPARRAALSAAGFDFVRDRYSWPALAEGLAAVYGELAFARREEARA